MLRVQKLSLPVVLGIVLLVVALLPPFLVVAGPAKEIGTTYTVNSDADPGDGTCNGDECTLREAIAAANSHPGKDSIVFGIGCLDAPIPVISVQSPLPDITDPVFMDGTNLASCPLNPWLSGGAAGGGVWGLTISAGDSQIQDMWIANFAGGAIQLKSSGSNVITNNLLRQNAGVGIGVQSGSNDNTLFGNTIYDSGGNGITIFNGSTGNTISENSLSNNGGLGIDLGNDGVTQNDADDSDTGANHAQNYPLITSLRVQGSQTTVGGTLQSTPNTTFKLEFFANNKVDPTAFGEGATFLGATNVRTGSGGQATFQTTLNAIGRNVTAVATNLSTNDTSEFSPVLGSKDVAPDSGTQHLGSLLYYTFQLRGALGAGTASIDDPIPPNAAFVPGSLWASSGAPQPVYDEANNRVTWAGSVAQGATVQVRFAVTSTCGEPGNPPPPEEVRNQATINIGGGSFDALTITPVELPPKDLTTIAESPADNARQVPIETKQQTGPLLKWRDQQDNMTCGLDPNTDDVYYQVYLRARNGNWQEIGTSPNCDRQIQLDADALACLQNGDPAPYEWKVVAYDPKFTCREPVETISHFATGACHPEIEVKPKFGDYFLSGIGVENTYRVEVEDWNGEAFETDPQAPYGDVYFELNGEEVKIAGADWGAEQNYDMGSDFQASLSGGNNTLRIKAINAAGYESLQETLEPFVFPLPGWITTFVLGNFEIDLQALTVKYARDIEYPDPHFEAQTEVPGWVPYLGGAKMGVIETYAAVGAEVSSDGTGSASLSGNTGAQITDNKKVTGYVSGEGNVRLGQTYGLDLTEAKFGLGIAGQISEDMGIADLVPALKAAESWPIVGRIVTWFNKRATVEAAIGPAIDLEAVFKDVNDELKFDSGTGTGLIDMSLTLSLKVLESLQASLTGGGTPRVVVQVPAAGPWGYLQEIAIRIYAKAALTVWRFEEEWERGVTCSLPSAGCVGDQGLDRAMSPGWRLMDRDYVNKAYATFSANDGLTLRASQSTTETKIVSHAFPLANPSLAVRGDDTKLLLWIHDDTSRAIAQGEEIYAAQWNGVTWQSVPLTTDQHQDFAPQVTFDADGDGVALWERTNVVHVAPSLNITYAQSFEIASARWVSATQTWSPPVTLTTNSLLDTSPQLAQGQDGAVMALWRTNDGADLLGSITHPVTLTFANWDAVNHTFDVAPALTGLTNTLKVDLAVYSATKAAIVLAHTDDLFGPGDLAYSEFNGTTWSSLTALTSDTITDTAPSLSYAGNGEPVIVWRRGDNLVMQTGWNGSPTSVRDGSTSGAFLDYQLLPDPSGNLALLWQTHSISGSDVSYSIYDAANSTWGADNKLMQDAALETSLSPAFGRDGRFYMAYNKVAMSLITTTVDISSTLSVTVTNIPQPDYTDIYLLNHTIDHDLRMGKIARSNPNPGPGSSVIISATIHNDGDLAVNNGEVAFYDGDPNAGGIQIGSIQSLSAPMPAATSQTVSVNWTVPNDITTHALYVVADPADNITERDETNNLAVHYAVQPDVQMNWVYSQYTTQSITLTANISNSGYITATAPFSVAFRATKQLTGPVLGIATITQDVSPNETVTATVAVKQVTLQSLLAQPGLSGNQFWAYADAGAQIDEADESNNSTYAALKAQPDLAIAATDIQGNGPMTITVHNRGVFTASAAILAVYRDGLTGTLIYSDALSELAAGTQQIITVDLGLAQVELWAKIDPNNLIAESNEGNNIAVRNMLLDVAPVSLTVNGPLTTELSAATPFTVSVNPPTSTVPLSITWQATDALSGTYLLYTTTDTIDFTWVMSGVKTIVVTATNQRGEAVSLPKAITVGAVINSDSHWVYLPLVLK